MQSNQQNGKKIKKIPQRKCVGCGESFPKSSLIRIVRSPEGEVSIDFTGKKSGRGVYVCKNSACLKKALKSNRIQKSLECPIPDEIAAALEQELEKGE